MTLQATTKRFLCILVVVVYCLANTIDKAQASQATVPLNITVHGKLVITDAENDNKAGEDPTLNINLELTPDLDNAVVSGTSAIRIRTNLSSWKLTAQRNNSTGSLTNINPQDISLSFTTQNGGNANPNAGKLLSPFNGASDLSKISSNAPTDILLGVTKTSSARDPKNQDNWFQLTSNYSVSPDFFYEIGDWGATVSYSLVSP